MAVQFRYLGGSGVKVSNICLGTMTFGQSQDPTRPGQCDEGAAHKILDRFAELGGNFIDTANVYVMGVSESIVGNWLAKRKREDFVLATKVRFEMDPNNPNSGGLSRKNIVWSLEESLKRLRTDYIDLYQIHAWDPATPIEETMRTLDDLVRAGKIRYVGASNVTGWQMQKIMDLCQYKGFNRWITLQAQYSLLNRELEWELVDCCKNEALGILPWSPLKGGWLTGKIKRDSAPEGSRVAFMEAKGEVKSESQPSFSKFAQEEKVWNLLDVMKAIADEAGKTVSQVALRWLLQKEAVCSVIIGVKTLDQLNNNMGASTGWELTDQQMKRLNEASAVALPYPYSMLARVSTGRIRSDFTQ
ncbi:1-deoxyxylulose-5-phosphate synthase YajO-like isoform X1 [Lytechinus variegatus]|uniref:1-deoxyxylulose-5-phosphate synthase YajO-like isoform X1 n=1 Tax=Lytechinus variegatus TaxID=7654 RepID=UPI001BB2A3AB|nr:1-deoxyxylulose-5-phosphate synthase YajO-like isoform X1 [Lytechinus variegatus]